MTRFAAENGGAPRRRTRLLLGAAIAAGAVPFVAAHEQPRPAPKRDLQAASMIEHMADRPAPSARLDIPSPSIASPGIDTIAAREFAPEGVVRPVERPAVVALTRLSPPAPPERSITREVPIAALSSGSTYLAIDRTAVHLVAAEVPQPSIITDEEPSFVDTHPEPGLPGKRARIALLSEPDFSAPPLVAVRLGPPIRIGAPVKQAIARADPEVDGAGGSLGTKTHGAREALLDRANLSPLPQSSQPSPAAALHVAAPAAAEAPSASLASPAPPAMASTAIAATGKLDPRVDIAQIAAVEPSARIAQLSEGLAKSRLAVRYDGREIGTVAFQVEAGHAVSVHIGQVLDLFQGEFDAARFAYLRGSGASDQYVSIDRLRAAGIPIRYDPVYDEIVLSPSAG